MVVEVDIFLSWILGKCRESSCTRGSSGRGIGGALLYFCKLSLLRNSDPWDGPEES